MTENTETLITEARRWESDLFEYAPTTSKALLVDLADALESEHARAEAAEAERDRLRAVMGRGFTETLHDRDEAYGEIIRLRQAIEDAIKRLYVPMHPYGDPTIPEVPEIEFLDDAYGEIGRELEGILSVALKHLEES